MQQNILGFMQKHGVSFGILCFIYLVGWFLKAIVGYNFDLTEYRQFLMVIATYLVGTHGINSGLNTKFGSNKPKEDNYELERVSGNGKGTCKDSM